MSTANEDLLQAREALSSAVERIDRAVRGIVTGDPFSVVRHDVGRASRDVAGAHQLLQDAARKVS